MLEDAGVEFEVIPADVNEDAAKQGKDLETIAQTLAEAKAVAVSKSHPNRWVLGSDSVVSVNGKLFSKPKDREDAAKHLRTFSGQTMLLSSGVALARDGLVDWRHYGRAELDVRPLSEEFIQSYLDAEWPAVGETVGVFRMEGRGVQLFQSITGGHFTILGMPLIPVLKRLRRYGLLLS